MHNTTHTPGPSTHARGRAGLISLIGVLALLAASLSTAFPAPGGLYAQSLTLPPGGLWLPGARGGPQWFPDHLRGICRLDGSPIRTITPATCIGGANPGGPIKPGQPAFDS